MSPPPSCNPGVKEPDLPPGSRATTSLYKGTALSSLARSAYFRASLKAVATSWGFAALARQEGFNRIDAGQGFLDLGHEIFQEARCSPRSNRPRPPRRRGRSSSACRGSRISGKLRRPSRRRGRPGRRRNSSSGNRGTWDFRRTADPAVGSPLSRPSRSPRGRASISTLALATASSTVPLNQTWAAAEPARTAKARAPISGFFMPVLLSEIINPAG